METVLFVCTGNQCRSPMAAGMLHRARPELAVTSAGLLMSGVAASAGSVKAMATRHIALDDHRSRRMDAAMIEDADLVVGMARRHVREAVLLVPSVLPRAFTLKEVVRRAEIEGARPAGVALRDWLALVHGTRRPTDLIGDDPGDDVKDPMGQPQAVYDATARELDDLIDRLAALAFPSG